MSDIPYIQATQEVKIAGQDATGNNVNYVGADSSGNMLVKQTSAGPVTPGTIAVNSELVGGQYNTTLPSPTNAQQVALQVDYKGRLITAPSSFSFFHPVYTTRIQTASNSNSANTTTLSVTTKATQSGSLIAVCASSASGTLTCTDSASQTYSTAQTQVSGNFHSYIFYVANSVSGVTSVTITDGTSTALNIIVSEYSNITTSSPLDKTTGQSNTGTAWTSGSTTTTAQANELLIGSAFDISHNNTTISAGTSWNAVNFVNNGAGGGGVLFQEEQYVNSTSTYAATGSASSNDTILGEIATFKISSYPTGFTIPNTATVLKSGPGTFSAVTISSLGTSGATATFYDNTTNSGTIIAVLSLTSSIGEIVYNAKFTNGLTMVVNSISGDFTVTYD